MNAKINQETNTIHFLEDDDLLEIVNQIERNNKRIVDIAAVVQDRDEQMQTEREYLLEVVKKQIEQDQMIVDE